MIPGYDHHQFVYPHRIKVKPGIGHFGQSHNGEFEFVIGYGGASVFRIHEVQVQVYLRVANFKLTQYFGQTV